MSEVTATATNNRGFFGEGNYPGIFGWIFLTDHKRSGLLYFWCIITFSSSSICTAVSMSCPLRPRA